MSGITPAGQLYTLVRQAAMTGYESVIFLKHLQHRLSEKLLVLWDGSPIHRGEAIKTFLVDGGAKHIHLEPLPAYAPDLNPTEGIWDLLKYVEMRNLCCFDLEHLDLQEGGYDKTQQTDIASHKGISLGFSPTIISVFIFCTGTSALYCQT